MPQPKKVQRTVSEHDSGISSMQVSSDTADIQTAVSSDATDHQTAVSSDSHLTAVSSDSHLTAVSSDVTDHQTSVSPLKIKEGEISKANTNAENTKNNSLVGQNKEIPNMEFKPKINTEIANENKKDSSEEGANEGYSYVSGQANLKPKVLILIFNINIQYCR